MLSRHETAETAKGSAHIAPLYGQRAMREPIPRWTIPEGTLEPAAAYQLIHDELSLDGNPLLNLASFVTTWMDPEADRLIAEAASKNFIDAEEYPITAAVERRCVSIIADLFHAPSASADADRAVGTSTIGSSEAIHLCGLAMKTRWRNRRGAAGLDTGRPNLVMSAGVHVTWEKFCRYFDVEARQVPLAPGRYVIDPAAAMALVDENTIGVVGILGTTYTGHFEPIADLDAAVAELNERTGWEVPVHVDAASGGFVAAFAYPHLAWDFRLPNVRSINVSGHKYGLVYPGVGWAIWRTQDDLPSELVFEDSYLGATQYTFDLNFSKNAGQIIGQYYNLIRLGRQGYAEVFANLLDVTGAIAERVQEAGRFELVSEPENLPLVCVRLLDDSRFNAHDLAAKLRERGLIVPAYNMPAAIEDMTVLRVVVREGFSQNLAEALGDAVDLAFEQLHDRPPAAPRPHRHSKNRPC